MKLFFLEINLTILINVYWLTRKSSYKYIQDGTAIYKGKKKKESADYSKWNCQVNDEFKGSEMVPNSSNSEDILVAFQMRQF